MAHIQDRGKDAERRWQARYRAPDGAERTKTFRRKVDAQRWLDEVTADIVTGRYVDPKAGKVTFGKFAERWLAAQTFDPSTREAVRNRLDNHILPTFEKTELRAIRPSMIQAWLRGRQQELAPRTVRTLLANLSGILGAAVEDGLIARNPCASSSVRAPSVPAKRIVPWTVEQVEGIVGAHPERYGATAVVCAGCGLRQGEAFGLAVDAVDFLRQTVHVRQPVKLLAGKPIFAPPKGGKIREVPLPEWVAVALAEHLRRHPPIEITLPWRDLDGPLRASQLVFTSRESRPVNRNYFNPHIWKPSLSAVGIAATRDHGMHALRHHYASVLLDGGISIRALAEYLGHADPGFTLRIYSHLMPNTEDRARAVVDAAHDRREDSHHEAGGETGDLRTPQPGLDCRRGVGTFQPHGCIVATVAAAKKLHKDMAAAMQALADAGWTVDPAKGKSHAAYIAKCPHGCCYKSINGTPRNPTGAARAMERWPGKCAKGTN